MSSSDWADVKVIISSELSSPVTWNAGSPVTSEDSGESEAGSQSSALIRIRDSGLRWRSSPPDLPRACHAEYSTWTEVTTSVVSDELDHVASLELTEAGLASLELTEASLRSLSPRDVIQRSEAVLAHRVDVVLSF